MWIREGHGATRNLSQSGSNEQCEDQRLKGIFLPKPGIQAVFQAESRWSQKKKGSSLKLKGISGQNRDFKRLFRPKTSDLQKTKTKKVFTEIERNFPAKIRTSRGFSGRKQVIFEKKDLLPKNVMKSGVSPQKLRKCRWHTPIWASICSAVAPSLLISSGHSPRLWRGGTIFVWGGTSSHLGGHGPGMPPRGAGSGGSLTQKPKGPFAVVWPRQHAKQNSITITTLRFDKTE